jgi:DnaJ-class molecular chaperone
MDIDSHNLDMKPDRNCLHCEGRGYVEIRDCSGEIQREETCYFCDGTGSFPPEE